METSKMPSVFSIPYHTACVYSGSATRPRKRIATCTRRRRGGSRISTFVPTKKIDVLRIPGPKQGKPCLGPGILNTSIFFVGTNVLIRLPPLLLRVQVAILFLGLVADPE